MVIVISQNPSLELGRSHRIKSECDGTNTKSDIFRPREYANEEIVDNSSRSGDTYDFMNIMENHSYESWDSQAKCYLTLNVYVR